MRSEFEDGPHPRYRMWTRENWQGHAPTINGMAKRGWTLSIHCQTCRLPMVVDIDRIIRERSPTWSPWGKSAPSKRLYCAGRMRLRAYAPGPGYYIDI